jgi:hypothetical protein
MTMRINYDNIPDMMMDQAFWDLIRSILFDDTSRIAHGMLAKLKAPRPRDDRESLKTRLRAALWLILLAAVTGTRAIDRRSAPPPIMIYDEFSDLYVREFAYLLRLLDRGVGLDDLQRWWGIDIRGEI